MITRRRFAALAGGSAAALAAGRLAAPAIAQGKPKVVVVGGGAGGATAARYIAKDAAGAIDVTLVEPQRTYTTCFHSNLYLGGFKSLEELTHGYEKLAAHGVRVVHERAAAIDRDKKAVRLADGTVLAYDRLVLSPGIDLKYDSVPGWSREAEEVMPHAWKAGPQTKLLKAKLDAVPDGGLILIVSPPNPYRCPPGPYERASMMAHVLHSTGRRNARIIILDAKDKFSKEALFEAGWEKYYPGMVEWLPPSIHDGIKSIDVKTSTVTTGFETYRNVALVNVIPAQWAGAIAREADLADDSGYCPIDAAGMKSAKDAHIHILGDAIIGGDMPKSAFGANQQAKVAAMVVRGELTGSRMFPPRFTNSCWSLIETDDAVKVGGTYENKDGRITSVTSFVSNPGEPAAQRREQAQENIGWYAGITADIFG